MTTLNDIVAIGGRRRTAGVPTVDVFGVAWPQYKLHAVLAGLAAVAVVLVLGGTGALAMWVSAAAVLLVWWGERAAFGARWDDSGRDHHSRS